MIDGEPDRSPSLSDSSLAQCTDDIPMPLKPWKKLAESLLLRNPWWSYRRDTYEIRPGTMGEYHYVHTNGSSMIIPVLNDGKVLMVNQYRYLLDRESVEFPCGSVKDGATYDQTALMELAEETGYSAKRLFEVGEFNPYNGITDEMCHVYLARELQFVGGTPDETEEFELLTMDPGEIDQKVQDGTIWDGMSIAAWGIVRGKKLL